MNNDVLIYIGSGVVFLWGAAHLFPTRNIVEGFGDISADNRCIITMEWIAEGVALLFAGVLPAVVTMFAGSDDRVSGIVYLLTAGFLVVMALVAFCAGRKTSIIPIRICPLILLVSAVLLVLGCCL